MLEESHGFWDVILVDANKDGRLELLVTNVDKEVWLIEIPTSENFR